MARKDIGNKIDRENRNAHNDNYKELYKEVNDFKGSITDELYERIIDGAKLNWKEPVASQSDLPSSATEGDTRMARDTGKVYRYDGSKWVEIQQIDAGPVNELDSRLTSQLAETALGVTSVYNRSRKENLTSIPTIKPTATFIDDDTHGLAYDIVYKDFVQGRNIPYTFALISSRINHPNGNHLMLDEFLEMKEDPRVTFVNHTVTHPRLGELSDEQFEQEVADCEAFLQSYGIYTSCLVPPFGSINTNQYSIARKYVDSILISTRNEDIGDVNTVKNKMLDSNKIVRVDFSREIEKIKDMVDIAIANDAWLIISTHCHYPQDQSESLNFIPEKLHELIDYMQLKGIEIADFETAFDRFKNPIEFYGTPNIGLSAGGFNAGLHGGFYFPRKPSDAGYKPSSSDAPSAFPSYTLTSNVFSNSEYAAKGWPEPGTLLTAVQGSNEYGFQIYKPIRNGKFLVRYWLTGGGWSDFIDLQPKPHLDYATGAGVYDINSPPSDFPRHKVISYTYNHQAAADAGFPSAGTLIMHNGGSDDYAWQEYKPIRSSELLKRHWTTSGWSNFE